MAIPVDVNSGPKAIEELESHFSSNPYVKGQEYSDADEKLFDQIKMPIDSASFPNFATWYSNVKTKLADSAPQKAGLQGKGVEGAVEGADSSEAHKSKQEHGVNGQKKGDKYIAKSLVVMDVKPWDETTDLVELTKKVMDIKKDGLIWGTNSLEPLGYGVMKLRIACAVEDEKVSVDGLISEIEAFDEHVQSVDIVSFNKI